MERTNTAIGLAIEAWIGQNAALASPVPATRCAKHLVATNGHLTAQPVAVLQDLSEGAAPSRIALATALGRGDRSHRETESFLVSRRDDRASPRAAPHCGSRRVTRPRQATPRHTSAPPRATLALNASTQDVAQLAHNRKLGHHPEHPDQEEAARRRRQLGVALPPSTTGGRKDECSSRTASKTATTAR